MSVGAAELGSAVSTDMVWNIVEGVWESLIGAFPDPVDPVAFEEPLVSSSVAMYGDWAAAVAFSCPRGTAEHMARIMLDAHEDERLSRLDVEDAMAEVVNVIGGNVKSLLEAGFRLGLPAVTGAHEPVGGELVDEVTVGWDGHRAKVTLWHLPSYSDNPSVPLLREP